MDQERPPAYPGVAFIDKATIRRPADAGILWKFCFEVVLLRIQLRRSFLRRILNHSSITFVGKEKDMTRNILTGVVAVALLAAFTVAETIGIGAEMPAADVEMTGTDSKTYTLNDLKKENGLLVVFSCNTCPFVVGRDDSEGWDGRYNDLSDACEKYGVGMVLVNSNEAKRSNGDSMDDMMAYANERELKSPYVLDKNHVVADAFGARTTPHIFLFGADNALKYKGAIDDNVDKADSVKEPWLRDALKAMNAGKKIDPNDTRNIGCSIKRVKS